MAYRWCTFLALACTASVAIVRAEPSPPDVRAVITEVLWAGSDVSSSDEWVGIGCIEGQEGMVSTGGVERCAVGGWTLTSVNGAGQEVTIARLTVGASIPAGSEAVISRMTREASRLDVDPFLISPDLTLPNTKLLLRLRDASGAVADIVDDGAGSPLAGANPSGGTGRASMERIDPRASGTDAANWRTATESRGFDAGAQVMGSPGLLEETEVTDVTEETKDDGTSSSSVSSVSSASSVSCRSVVPDIVIQSGSPRGIGKITINVQAVAREGSLQGAVCRWEYPDGWKSESCNPPVRTVRTEGASAIRLAVTDACGNLTTRDLPVEVISQTEEEIAQRCIPTAFTGVLLSELSPMGDEWIELVNHSGMERILCRWSIDDGDGGSAAFALDAQRIGDGGRLLLPRKLTSIALNDDGDSARLFAPSLRGQSGGLVDVLTYEDIEEEHVLARREDDGTWLQTPYPTPGDRNRFRDPLAVSGRASLAITAALPNPAGEDDGGEWIEITNIGGRPALLRGMSLIIRSPSGRENRVALPADAALARLEVMALHGDEFALRLPSDGGTVVLVDTDGNALSALSWDHTGEGKIVRASADRPEVVRAEVLAVIDGDTIDVRTLDDRGALADAMLPDVFRVRLLGIDAPENREPGSAEAAAALEFLLADRPLHLLFDRQRNDQYGRFLAYVEDAETRDDIGRLLLRRGLVSVLTAFPFARMDDYRAVEEDARRDAVGIWSTFTRGDILQSRKTNDVLQTIVSDGFAVAADPPPGIVASGTLLRLRTDINAALFVSVNSGAYQLSDGDLLINAPAVIRAYAVASGVQPSCGTVATPVWSGRYDVYQPVEQPVTIGEILPSPPLGETEWIELMTTGSGVVSLGGWTVDDVRGGGSRPWVIPLGTILSAKEPLLLRKDQTHLTLNDSGDDIWLLRPDGSVSDHANYAHLKRGQSWTPECVTSTPTPGTENRCESTPVLSLIKGLKSKKTKARKPRTSPAGFPPLLPAVSWSDGSSLTMDIRSVADTRGALTLAILILTMGVQGAALWAVRRQGVAA
ncbi:MAG: nuclease [Candidatus Peregrinibacteria bacterium Gr01-1014_25]|nr:MAG: nuclease [Candidatus Peregrinibacteria bacterium Gr01-1014_25]